MESKHLNSFTQADLYYFEELQMGAQSSGALGKKLKDSLKACEVKKWAENENTTPLPVFSKWLLSRLALKPASAWARADTSAPRKFTVKCNLNVRGDRVINVTTQTWTLLPFFLRCEERGQKHHKHIMIG